MPNRLIRSIIANQKILVAPPQTTVFQAAKMMKDNHLGNVLVVEGGKLLGIFTERDALYRVMSEGRDAKITLLAQTMTPNPQTIGPDQPFGQALQMMFEGGYRHVPVVEDGRPIGIVSVRDALSGNLSELAPEPGRLAKLID